MYFKVLTGLNFPTCSNENLQLSDLCKNLKKYFSQNLQDQRRKRKKNWRRRRTKKRKTEENPETRSTLGERDAPLPEIRRNSPETGKSLPEMKTSLPEVTFVWSSSLSLLRPRDSIFGWLWVFWRFGARSNRFSQRGQRERIFRSKGLWGEETYVVTRKIHTLLWKTTSYASDHIKHPKNRPLFHRS